MDFSVEAMHREATYRADGPVTPPPGPGFIAPNVDVDGSFRVQAGRGRGLGDLMPSKYEIGHGWRTPAQLDDPQMRDRVANARSATKPLFVVLCSEHCDHLLAKLWPVRRAQAVEVRPSGECFLLEGLHLIATECSEHGYRPLPTLWLLDKVGENARGRVPLFG